MIWLRIVAVMSGITTPRPVRTIGALRYSTLAATIGMGDSGPAAGGFRPSNRTSVKAAAAIKTAAIATNPSLAPLRILSTVLEVEHPALTLQLEGRPIF
jgi:hypothetical protein